MTITAAYTKKLTDPSSAKKFFGFVTGSGREIVQAGDCWLV